jgi:predicted dehydrogenase
MQSVRGFELAGVTAPVGAEALAAKAVELGVGHPKVYGGVGDLARNVDVIFNLAPNFAKLDVTAQILAAVNQGNTALKGVIVEKPLARNVAEARRMVDLAKQIGVPTSYFENQLHMPSVAQSRQQLAQVESAMGPVHLTRSAEEHGGPHEPWFWDPTRQGGGVWCDMGCHSAAVGMYMLTPSGKPPDYLIPMEVTATMGLLKWGKKPWIDRLRERGVDYSKTPAEDYALVTIRFRDPETGMISIAQATDSWMYDAPGLRLFMEALGPGYSYTVNSLQSPVGLFISDAAAEAVSNAELALEKAQATRGALILQPNEPDLYGYVAEQANACAAFNQGRDAMLNWEYGALVTRLVTAGYMAAERGKTIKLEDPAVQAELETYIPLIQQGRGAEVLFGRKAAGA